MTITFKMSDEDNLVENEYNDYVISVQTNTITKERHYLLIYDDEVVEESYDIGTILQTIAMAEAGLR
jgi:hypothetical protein